MTIGNSQPITVPDFYQQRAEFIIFLQDVSVLHQERSAGRDTASQLSSQQPTYTVIDCVGHIIVALSKVIMRIDVLPAGHSNTTYKELLPSCGANNATTEVNLHSTISMDNTHQYEVRPGVPFLNCPKSQKSSLFMTSWLTMASNLRPNSLSLIPWKRKQNKNAQIVTPNQLSIKCCSGKVTARICSLDNGFVRYGVNKTEKFFEERQITHGTFALSSKTPENRGSDTIIHRVTGFTQRFVYNHSHSLS